MYEWLMLGVGFLLTIGTGFFVASEFALVNLDRADLEARRERGETRLKLTIEALKITSTHLSSAQLGITLTTLLTGYTMEPAMTKMLTPVFASWGVPEVAVSGVAVVVSVSLATIISMILGELVPKNFALALPRQTAKFVIGFQTGFTAIFRIAVVGLNDSANALIRMMGIEPKEELTGARSAEELSSLLRRSVVAGSLDKDTAGLLNRTLTFAEHTAADVMTPRFRLATLEKSDTALDVLELTRKTGYSRFPVIDESPDKIVGVVHVKQALAVPRERRAEVPLAALMREPLEVPETMKLDTLLGELRKHSFQLAIVLDEYGGTAGLATLEDLVEEIVGDLLDEHDRVSAKIVHQADTVLFPGILRPDELHSLAGIEVPEDGAYETVAGFILDQLGTIPEVGVSVALESGTLRVERMDGRRIDRIRYIPQNDDEVDHG
ncbi:MAG: hemolysin family protein [Microbacteriaceae bacterium]